MRLAAVLPLLLCVTAAPTAHASEGDRPRVAIETSEGTIVVELRPDKAPETVANFLRYVKDGFYDGTIFHRVIQTFMIQGGGFTAEMKKKDTRAPIKLEVDEGLSNARGTIAMARTAVKDSATAQFFINTVDNKRLDTAGGGYAVFGRVVEGMKAVDAIAAVATARQHGMGDVPLKTMLIKKATVTGGAKAKKAKKAKKAESAK